MRVLMVSDFYWPHVGGVEQHVRTLAQTLAERGHQVAVATTRTGELAEREADGPVDVIRIRTSSQRLPGLHRQHRPWAPPVPDPGAARALRRIVDDIRPDVIHGHDWLARSLLPLPAGSPPLVSTLHYYTLTCAKKTLLRAGHPCPGPALHRCIPCAAGHYGLVKGPITALATAVGRRMEERDVAAFVSVSAAAAEGNAIEDKANHHVVPNFLVEADVTSAAVRNLVDRLPAEPFFVYVGDFRPAKGFDVLLAAYAQLDTTRPLVVIGKRWPESPTTLPSGTLLFENWPNAAVRAAFGRAHAAIVPSVWAEPFGIVAIEAMAAGVPVIASETGGLAELVHHGRTGLLVAPGAVDELAGAMQLLDDDEDFTRRLGSAARDTAAGYRADAVVPAIEEIYASVAGRNTVDVG